ncbi:hypothetical protein Rhopal_003009-T1 [Rhodotorula paludigena]|uniref:Glutaredoxin domain-containing protein n=1 Tax=Rhodotorula paludigena TaxID=86838 RepID=A0AAV5GJF2_9BASI|nr:hypothetical protein Rhopal_003009-T1 [Rhodotorula paludigena]
MTPAIDVFVTSILSNPAIRGRHERVRRGLTSVRVPYSEHDVAGDEAAKSLWKRKSGNKNELPFLLVDGEPVGNIEEFDEAVEFGELRQFLRLDSDPIPPPPTAPPPDLTASAASSHRPSPASSTHSEAGSPRQAAPSLDDFASLNLSPSELAELAREIQSGETFSSGLGSLSPWTGPNVATSASGAQQGYDFGTTATRRIEPVFSPTAPLRLEKVNFTRPLPDRPLASDVARDELAGIDLDAEGLNEDALEKLVREMEAEEEERRRLRDAQGDGSRGVEPPPLPEKEPDQHEEPALPSKPAEEDTAKEDSAKEDSAKDDIARQTAVENDGGAELSAPIAEVQALRLSPSEKEELAKDALPAGDAAGSTSTTLAVEPADKLEKELAAAVEQAARDAKPPPAADAPPSPARGDGATRSSAAEVQNLKSSLSAAGTAAAAAQSESEMPHFGVSDMLPHSSGSAAEKAPQGEAADELSHNVAAAIRLGDL